MKRTPTSYDLKIGNTLFRPHAERHLPPLLKLGWSQTKPLQQRMFRETKPNPAKLGEIQQSD